MSPTSWHPPLETREMLPTDIDQDHKVHRSISERLDTRMLHHLVGKVQFKLGKRQNDQHRTCIPPNRKVALDGSNKVRLPIPSFLADGVEVGSHRFDEMSESRHSVWIEAFQSTTEAVNVERIKAELVISMCSGGRTLSSFQLGHAGGLMMQKQMGGKGLAARRRRCLRVCQQSLDQRRPNTRHRRKGGLSDHIPVEETLFTFRKCIRESSNRTESP